ncbi:MAG: zinc ribbon domain-containing protein [Chloroflexota bacterium]
MRHNMVMTVAARLFLLEKMDAAMAQREIALAELRKLRKHDPKVAAAETSAESARARASHAAAEQRRLEGDLADIEGKITRDHNRLYGGQIIDPRELALLQRELERFRESRDAIENTLLAAMERSETAQGEVSQRSRQASELREQREADLPELAREEEEAVDALAALRDQRNAAAAEIEPDALAMYQRLRKLSPHAVSRVANGVCQQCRVTIPPKDVQHARAGALVPCPNCSRVLYPT